MAPHKKLSRPRTALACGLALAVAAVLAACGVEEQHGIGEPAREGVAVKLGGVAYNVYITRQLNPKLPEDSAYWQSPEPRPGFGLYGVFLIACNTTERTVRPAPADGFKIADSQGNEYEPEPVEAANEAFAYDARPLANDECIPRAGSVASLGPTAGALLVFRLPKDALENRPLELEIPGPGDETGKVDLDI